MHSFVSTRGGGPVPFADALFRGLAPDGGLYVPERLPHLGESAPPPRGDFPSTAIRAADSFLCGVMEPEVLRTVVRGALDFPVPLVRIEEDVHVLELFHGPSLAFKDVGARFMARAMAGLRPRDDATTTVLVATSGDTGGAVATAFHGLHACRVVVLFPRDGISSRQRRQMTTLGGNVTAVAVDGTFDDCQRLAKQAFADAELQRACGLTSANSINVGRLLPQALYYLHAAAQLGWGDPPATFVVPSGNLGNLCAGLLAFRAGMPARSFVAALNPNRAFADYLATGDHEPRPSASTLSNAMDVGDPSNLERIRWLYGDDVTRVRADVHAVSSDDAETRACIARVHGDTGYVMDPHTAVGWCALEKVRREGRGPWIVLATAHPAKFPEVVEEATGEEVPLPPSLEGTLSRPESMVEALPRVEALRAILLDGVTAA